MNISIEEIPHNDYVFYITDHHVGLLTCITCIAEDRYGFIYLDAPSAEPKFEAISKEESIKKILKNGTVIYTGGKEDLTIAIKFRFEHKPQMKDMIKRIDNLQVYGAL